MGTLLALLIPLGLLAMREIPAGARMHVRLTTPVGSFATVPGSPISGVLIAPVEVNGSAVVPAGTRVEGVVRSVRRVGLGLIHESPGLTLEFHRLVLPSGGSVPIRARLIEVDNARESLNAAGQIKGVRATASLVSRTGSYIRQALQTETVALPMVWAIRTLLVSVPEPEIYYPYGVEMTLALAAPVRFLSLTPAEDPEVPAFIERDRATIARLLDSMPDRTHTPVSNRPSDIINVAMVGRRDEVETAFEAAGWVSADPSSLRSKVRELRAIVGGNAYRFASMSDLHVANEEADLSLQKGLNDASKRHHIRIWNTGHTWNGTPVWIAAATRDVDYAYLRPGRPVTHRIEQYIDREREKVAHDLIFASCVDSADWLDRPDIPRLTRNATGDLMTTDGRIAVLRLRECSAQPVPAAAKQLKATGNRGYRLLRREILSLRDDYTRQNIYWRGFEGARWVVRTLSNRRRNPADPDPCYRETNLPLTANNHRPNVAMVNK